MHFQSSFIERVPIEFDHHTVVETIYRRPPEPVFQKSENFPSSFLLLLFQELRNKNIHPYTGSSLCNLQNTKLIIFTFSKQTEVK